MAGEEEGRWEAMLVAELGRGEPGLLTRFWQVCLGGHEDAGDLAVHVVLLQRQGEVPGRGKRPTPGRCGAATQRLKSHRAPASYLINTGTVAERSGVPQVIDEAGDIAGCVRRLHELHVGADLIQLGQEVKGRVAQHRLKGIGRFSHQHTDCAGVTTATAQPRGAGMALQQYGGGTHSPALLQARHSSNSLLSLTYYKVLLLAVDLHRVDRVEGRVSWVLPLGLPSMKTPSQTAGSKSSAWGKESISHCPEPRGVTAT